MAALAGILNQSLTAGRSLANASAAPMASSTNQTGSADNGSSTSASISANDFLTLLVTEMQNQDPTATTDPNEYINQLVQVNSLEQLISINQTLTTGLGGSTATASTSPASYATTTGAALSGKASALASQLTGTATSGSPQPSASLTGSGAAPSGYAASQGAGLPVAGGNLGIPNASAAAMRVAQALSGRSRPNPLAGGLPAVQ